MNRPDHEGPPLTDALALRRQAVRGVVVGILLASGLFTFFVLVPGADRAPVWYVGLAFVVAVTTAGLVTLVLVAYRVHRLATRTESPES